MQKQSSTNPGAMEGTPRDFVASILNAMSQYSSDTATRCQGIRVSYRELDVRSAAVAAAIAEKDLPRNCPIGVMMDRSNELLVVLLGVLRAGHAFVPVDPQFPIQRTRYMVEHSGVPLVICDPGLRNRVSGAESETVHELELNGEGCKPADNFANGDDLAYVIYTSGSTGTPKGVMISRAAVSNFLSSMSVTPGIEKQDVLLAVTTVSFDIAYLELFLPLTVGAVVEIASRRAALDGVELGSLIDSCAATVMQATPATWQMLFAAGWSGNRKLKVLCGGEAAPTELFELLYESTASVWNMYGPTETTIWSSCYEVSDTSKPILLGPPIQNTEFHVLDEDDREVAPGGEGELHIGGSGLADGYYRDDVLSNERFVELPHVCSDARLYKTGDLVRLIDRERISFVGRNDNQVKIRGFRIELGEIEFAIAAHAAVEQVAARVVNSEVGEKTLAAYFTVSGGSTPSLGELRDCVLLRLPAYMVPQRFLLLEQMPLTPNRKIDRKALDGILPLATIADGPLVAPRNEAEHEIHDIWCEMLGVDRVGVDQDFFQIGGHSLTATRMWARLKSRLAIDIPLKTVFELTTISALAERISTLNETKSSQNQIPVISRLRAPVMSVTQQRFWYIDQLTKESPLFNLCAAFRLAGPLLRPSMQSAFEQLIARHEILRTTLSWDADHPLQIIQPALNFELETEDLSDDPPDKSFERLMTSVNVRIKRKVLLDTAPAFDTCLYILGEHDHVLFFMPHHVIWDGWSFDIFLAELKSLYEADVAGETAALPELPIHYADYSDWHRKRVEGTALDSQLQYWRTVLDNDLPILDMPTDFPRPTQFNFDGATEYIEFDSDVVAGIADLAGQNSTTVNVVVLALYFGLLHRYTGQDDIIVGSPIQGRLSEETENLIGLFVNTLPIRGDLSGDPNIVELVCRVRDAALEAYQNQEVPFEKLVELFGQGTDFSRPPIYQTLFTFQEVSDRDSQFGESTLSQINLHNGTCPTEISFWLKSSPTELHGAVEYNLSLFNEDRIRRLIRHLKRFFAEAVRNASLPVSMVDYIDADERRMLIAELNDTNAVRTTNPTLQELLAAPLRRGGRNIALEFGDTKLTYEHLHFRANRIANKLRSLVTSDNAVIGVCLTRSPDLVVAMLACLKGGFAYLPVDSEMPDSRNAGTIQAAGAEIVVTEARFEALVAGWGAPILVLDERESGGGPDETADDEPQGMIEDAALAYVTFTSGSTGTPKGVAVPRSAVTNFLHSMLRVPGIAPSDKVLGLTTITFDIHVLEILGTLVAGGTIVLVGDAEATDGYAIASAIEGSGITLMQATPSTWHLLDATGWQGKQDLKALVGGEAVSEELATSLSSKVGELWNMYGPTETTVWSTCCELKPGVATSIGRPIDNTEVYVLDRNRQLVGVGVCGELYIAGQGLAVGYRNDSIRTQQRFVYLDIDGRKRAYRTGDVVYVTESGELRYVERLDNQVKVRGFRIELGEIENALLGIEGIAQAAAKVISASAEDARIIGYYVVDENHSISTPNIRKMLRQQLPYYMVPQHFVALTEMPVNSSGKLDRNQLPDPAHSIIGATSVDPPESENEKVIAELWKELIGVETVSRNDNFFEIGGHSLLSMKFISELRQRTGSELHVRDVVLSDLREVAGKMLVSSADAPTGEDESRSKYR